MGLRPFLITELPRGPTFSETDYRLLVAEVAVDELAIGGRIIFDPRVDQIGPWAAEDIVRSTR